MPAIIVATPDDPANARGVAYVPDPFAAQRNDPHRPRGGIRPSAATRLPRLLPDPRFVVSADIAQASDYTAAVALERLPNRHYAVPMITRAPIGTPYPRIVEKLNEIATTPPFLGNCHLVVDATGVGRPMVDMLRAGPVPPVAVTITGGQNVHGGNRAFSAPKRDLISAAQLAFQAGRLKIAAQADHAETLIKELAEFRVRISAAGHDTYGAWREGQHDDLVLALSIGLWWAERVGKRIERLMLGPPS